MTTDQHKVYQKFNDTFFKEFSYLFPFLEEKLSLEEYVGHFRKEYSLMLMFTPMPYKVETFEKYKENIVFSNYFPLSSGAKQCFTVVQFSKIFHLICMHTIDEEDNFIFSVEFLYKDIKDCSDFIEVNKDFENKPVDKRIGLMAGFGK